MIVNINLYNGWADAISAMRYNQPDPAKTVTVTMPDDASVEDCLMAAGIPKETIDQDGQAYRIDCK